MAQLNTTTSIVDYLKSNKQDSSRSARKNLYTTGGLNKRLGDYIGSGQQNTALLKSLQTQAQSNAQPEQPVVQDPTQQQGGLSQEQKGFSNVVGYLSEKFGRPPTSTELSEYFRPKTEAERTGLPQPTAQTATPAVSAAETLAKVTGTPEFQLQQESAQLSRSNVERGLKEAKAGTQKTYENRGIPSSGMKDVAMDEQETSAAAQQLGISQSLAGIVLTAIRDDQAAQAKQQEADDKTRYDSLKAMGYVEVNGKLMPTLESQKFEADQQEEPELKMVGGNLYRVFPGDREPEMVVQGQAQNVKTYTSERGVVTAVDEATGKTLWVRQIGRAGSAGQNISVSTITDPITGTPKYSEIKNKDTGKVTYIDNMTGEEVPADQVQIGEPMDAIDLYIKEALGEISESGPTEAPVAPTQAPVAPTETPAANTVASLYPEIPTLGGPKQPNEQGYYEDLMFWNKNNFIIQR